MMKDIEREQTNNEEINDVEATKVVHEDFVSCNEFSHMQSLWNEGIHNLKKKKRRRSAYSMMIMAYKKCSCSYCKRNS